MIGDWTQDQLLQFVQSHLTQDQQNQTTTGLNGKIDKPNPPPTVAGQVLVWDGAYWVASKTPSLPTSGHINQFAGSTAPNGWLLCDGSAISRTLFSSLFAITGTTYGVGDGSTTFNIPNIKGQVVAGLDAGQAEFNALGKTGGAKSHSHVLSDNGQAEIYIAAVASNNLQMRRITSGSWNSNISATFSTTPGVVGLGAQTLGAGLLGATDTTTGTTAMSPFITLNYIIKV